LDFLGFPWILSSESRLFNGLRGIFGGKFFLTLSWREKPERAPAVETIRKGGIVHGTSLLQFLIASNQLSCDPVEPAKLASFCWLPPKRTGRSKRVNLGLSKLSS
jgi:hypothetical protein